MRRRCTKTNEFILLITRLNLSINNSTKYIINLIAFPPRMIFLMVFLMILCTKIFYAIVSLYRYCLYYTVRYDGKVRRDRVFVILSIRIGRITHSMVRGKRSQRESVCLLTDKRDEATTRDNEGRRGNETCPRNLVVIVGHRC